MLLPILIVLTMQLLGWSYILAEYVVRPKETLRNGLSQWWHESDDDW